MPGHRVSIVVTSRNEPPDFLKATLTGLLETTAHHDREIFVIDDGSDLPVVCASPEVVVVRQAKSIGNSAARRLGASLSTGSVLVWLDAHMSFGAGWLDRMLEHVDCGAVLCSEFWRYDLSRCHCWGADFVWRGGRDHQAQRYPGFTVRHRTKRPAAGALEVPMLIGGCYMMLRRTYEHLGGFSPLSRVCGGSEQDLSARAWIAGAGVRCVTGAQVGHFWRPRFPYPVEFAQLEFNQLALVRTVFEEATARALENCFQPYSPSIQKLIDSETGFVEWRRTVQATRKLSDAEFFARFVPDMENDLRTVPLPLSPSAQRSPHQRTISFIVTAREEPQDVLEATIDGLLATSAGQDFEIVIVDDATEAPVAVDRPRTVVVRNPKPLGVAQSRRLGAGIATGGILVWMDAHMRFAPDWLDKMLAHVDSGALLCAAWWDYELSRPLCWGAEYVWCSERDHKAGRSPGLGFRHRTKFPGEGAVEVPMVIGACYMTLRESYERCGGFSPFFRIWGKSEQDLSARMWITGSRVKCVTGARVGHLSRPQFPYPVSWSDIEFNQAILFRALLEEPALRAVEELLSPLPAPVESWLTEVDLLHWRQHIQANRRMSDSEFFRRFVPGAPECLTSG